MATLETHDLLQHFKGSRNSRFLAEEEDSCLYAAIEKGWWVQCVKNIVQPHESVWCDVSTGERDEEVGREGGRRVCLLPPSSLTFTFG